MTPASLLASSRVCDFISDYFRFQMLACIKKVLNLSTVLPETLQSFSLLISYITTVKPLLTKLPLYESPLYRAWPVVT